MLIDSIVQQNAAVIARLVTMSDVRPPLGHLPELLFVALNDALAQPLGRRVCADLFELTPRSLRDRLRRARETPARGLSRVAEQIVRALSERGPLDRATLLGLAHDDDGGSSFASVLRDLTRSGVIAPLDGLYRLAAQRSEMEPFADTLVWIAVKGRRPMTLEEIQRIVPLSASEVAEAVGRLRRDQTVFVSEHDGVSLVHAGDCFIPPESGIARWAPALLDHLLSVSRAVCNKIDGMLHGTRDPRIGGSTYEFDLWAGHPLQARVEALLAEMRRQTDELADEVDAHNHLHLGERGSAPMYQVVVYFGQNVLPEVKGAPA